MTIPLDTVESWPQKGRGGFLRNQRGEVVVSHPDGGKRTLIYEGASGLLDFGKPYTGDPIHGERGTHVHELCDLADGTDGVYVEFWASAAAVGIPEALQRHIHDEWLRVRAAHGITTHAIEQCVVHDGWRVATNIDRIDITSDGRYVCADIKSSRDVVKAAYLLQLAVGASSITYDPDTGERTPWPVALDQSVGHIWHYPIAEAIAAHELGEPLPTWTLVLAGLYRGFTLGDTLHALKTDTLHKACFAAQSVPESPPDTVVSARNVAESPATLDEWRTLAVDWSPLKSEAFTEYRIAHGITRDATDAERLAAYVAFDHTYAFRGDVSTPVVRPVPDVPEQPVIRDAPDEGDTIPQSQVDTVGEAFKALPDEQRSWVALNGAKVRLNPQSVDGVASVRRFEIMRGLIAMARAGFDDDDTLRAVCDLAIGEDTQMSLKLPAIVGSLTIGEAQRFASICSDFIEAGDISMSFRADGRCVISRAAA